MRIPRGLDTKFQVRKVWAIPMLISQEFKNIGSVDCKIDKLRGCWVAS